MRWALWTLAIGLTLSLASIAAAGPLRVGAAAVVITPPPGTAMAGYYDQRLVQGVDNDLYAKAIVLEQDGTKAALVACDLIQMPRPISDEARRLVRESVGIAPDRVMISATHCHTGPALPTGSPGDPAQRWDLSKNHKYVAELPALIAQSVRRASEQLADARAFAGAGREEHLAFNRRYFMKDGTVGWNPGKLNPKIVRPAGPIDPQVPVVYFESPDGKPLAIYTNFAMHLDTVGGNRVSADFPYTLHTLLARIKGRQMLSLFTIGAAGDINHIDVSWKDPQHGEAEAARIGTILAGEVLKTSARLTPIQGTGIRAISKMVQLELPPVTLEDVAEAQLTVAKGAGERTPFLQRVKAFKVLDVAARNGKPLDAEVQVIALGDDVAWVGLPGEMFVELGLSIKQRSPFAHTIIAEMADGHLGYVPTREAYPQGNYEVVSARCAAGSGERLAQTAVELLRQLK